MDEIDQKLVFISISVIAALFVLFVDLPPDYSRWLKPLLCIVAIVIVMRHKIKNVGKRK